MLHTYLLHFFLKIKDSPRWSERGKITVRTREWPDSREERRWLHFQLSDFQLAPAISFSFYCSSSSFSFRLKLYQRGCPRHGPESTWSSCFIFPGLFIFPDDAFPNSQMSCSSFLFVYSSTVLFSFFLLLFVRPVAYLWTLVFLPRFQKQYVRALSLH